MTYAVTITSQGQLSLPIAIRRQLGFSKTKKALISVKNGRVIIEPIKDLLALGGSLKTRKKPLMNESIHQFVANAVAEEFAKKSR